MKRLIQMSLLALLVFSVVTMFNTPPIPAETTGEGRILRHLVLINFKNDADAEQVEEVVKAFGQLPARIDQIHAFEWGRETSVEKLTKGFTHCFLVSFKSEDDLKSYLPHPAHLDFVKQLNPVMEDVLVVDYWAKK